MGIYECGCGCERIEAGSGRGRGRGREEFKGWMAFALPSI